MPFKKVYRRSVGEIDRTKSRSIQHVLGFLSEFRLSSRGVNLFSFSAMRSRRKHYSNHGCAERLPKRSQITMECRQTSVPVRGTRWHTERSNDPCTVQRLRKEITPYRERQRGMEGRGLREREKRPNGPPRASFRLYTKAAYSTWSRSTLANVCELFEMLMGERAWQTFVNHFY